MTIRNRLVGILEFFVLLDEILSLALNFSHHFFESTFSLDFALLSNFGAYFCVGPSGLLLFIVVLFSHPLLFFNAATDISIGGQTFNFGDWPLVKIG
jgi:hypothetical protein